MILKRKYHTLIAELPDLVIDERKLPYTALSYRNELYPQLSRADKKLFDLFFLKYDNKNLLSYLKDKEASFDERGRYTADDFDGLIQLCKETEQPKQSLFPTYFVDFLNYYNRNDSSATVASDTDYLSALYYKHALGCRNGFVRNWFEMNLDLYNILAALTCRKYHYPVADFVIGDNATAKALRTSHARDFGLGYDVENFEKIIAVWEEPDLLVKEERIDGLKWQWIEGHAVFFYFTVEKLFANLLMLDILERWTALDKKAGLEAFRTMVSAMKGAFKQEEKINI